MLRELVDRANKEQKLISEIMIEQEILITERSREEIMAQMDHNLTVMEEAVEKGLKGVHSNIWINRWRCCSYCKRIWKREILYAGDLMLDAVSKAVATNEVNAAMGTICATPTAGSAGVVPGTLFAVKNKLNPTREQMIHYLFTSGAFGFVVANNASISGAAGGCQAEVGSAAGNGGSCNRRDGWRNAASMCRGIFYYIKNMLGLFVILLQGLWKYRV